jgi:uncharacterized membrane protein YeiB
VAFVGMVLVNFKIVMGATEAGGVLAVLTGALEGRAAATFVVLAGVGLGLSALRGGHKQTISLTFKRAAFLLALGLLNSLVFDADILHYYAFYFPLSVLLLPLRSRWLAVWIVLLNVAFTAMLLAFDYEAGWNWDDFTYAGFWTPAGFVRNLFFNGWHPVIPWLGFVLFGIVLSRLPLRHSGTQHRMIVFGATAYVLAEGLSAALSDPLDAIEPGLAVLSTTEPIPPMPLYMLAGLGAASVAIGLCLRCSGWLDRIGVLGILTPAGRQTLTLYIAHVLIGMGTLEELGMLGGQTLPAAVTAALLFCSLAVLYAFLWSRKYKRGPIEAAMRRLAG